MKKIFLLIFILLSAILTKAQVTVVGSVIPAAGGQFGVVTDTFLTGGYRTVKDTIARDNIFMLRRKFGMLVYDSLTNTTWQLKNGLTNGINNANWQVYLPGGIGSQNLQQVLVRGNSTNLSYRHKDTVANGIYIIVDTPYKFTTDTYSPAFTWSYHSDTLINPADSQADHVWDMGINLAANSSLLDTNHAGIGIQMESNYFGGLSSTIPAQEFHLFQAFPHAGQTNRFLTYAGLIDGSFTELTFNALKTFVGGSDNDQVFLVNQGSNEKSGMVISQFESHSYVPFVCDDIGSFNFSLTLTDNGQDGGATILAKETDSTYRANIVATNTIGQSTSIGVGNSNTNFPGYQGLGSLTNNSKSGLIITTTVAGPINIGTNTLSFPTKPTDFVIDTFHNVTVGNSLTVDSTLTNRKFGTDIYVTDYGVINDTTIDQSATVQAAFNAVLPYPFGGRVIFPSYGINLKNSKVVVNNPCAIIGTGSYYSQQLDSPLQANHTVPAGSILYSTSLTDTMLKITSAGVHIQNMAFINVNTAGGNVDTLPTSGSGVCLTNAGAAIVEACAFRGFYNNFVTRNIWNAKFDKNNFYGVVNHDFDQANPFGNDAGDWCFTNSNFLVTNNNAIGAYVGSGGGGKFIGDKFAATGHNITMENGIVWAETAPGTAQLTVMGGSIENTSDNAIKVIRSPGALFHTVKIIGVDFQHYGATEFKPFIYMDNIGVVTITGNTFVGANTTQDTIAVQLDSASSGTIVGNTYTNYGTSKNIVKVTYPFTTAPQDQTAVTGVNSIGTINGTLPKGINGFSTINGIADNFIRPQSADSVFPGLVDTLPQTFKGTKTFVNNIITRGTTSTGTTKSASIGDSLLGKNNSGQIVSLPPYGVSQLNRYNDTTTYPYKTNLNPTGTFFEIKHPSGAFINTTSSTTGAFVITLPASVSNPGGYIFDITVNGSNASLANTNIELGGFFNTNTAWSSAWVKLNGNNSNLVGKIRLGYNGSSPIIIIGDTTTIWTAGTDISVESVMASNGAPTPTFLMSGWSIPSVTTWTGLSNILLINVQNLAIGDNVNISGNSTVSGNDTVKGLSIIHPIVSVSTADSNLVKDVNGVIRTSIPVTAQIADTANLLRSAILPTLMASISPSASLFDSLIGRNSSGQFVTIQRQHVFTGTATLINGTVTISNTNIKTGTPIMVSLNTPVGSIGTYAARSADIINGTSFVIISNILSVGVPILNTADNSSVNYSFTINY